MRQKQTKLISEIATGITISLLTLVCIELFLRIQQKLGPLIDVNFAIGTALQGNDASDILNHKNEIGVQKVVFDSEVRFGPFGLNKHVFTREYDAYGLRVDHLLPRANTDQALRILFLGDSFMQGYDDAHTIPFFVSKFLREGIPQLQLDVSNGGTSSYSPLIFIAQAKYLAPYVRPQMIVCDIDETDIFDDERYKEYVVRNSKNELIAVQSSPELNHLRWMRDDVRNEKLFLLKAFKTLKYYLARNELRLYSQTLLSKDIPVSLAIAKDFEQNVEELSRTLLGIEGGDPSRVVMIRHPHIMHLEKDSNGKYFESVVGETVKKVASRYQIPFYDATNDLRRLKVDPSTLYWPGDMHFNFTGIELYSRLVANYLKPLIPKPNGRTQGDVPSGGSFTVAGSRP